MIGFDVKAIDFSPIKGPEGNIEYLMYITKKSDISEEILSLEEKEAEEKLRDMLEEKTGLAFEEDFKKIIEDIVSGSHEL